MYSTLAFGDDAPVLSGLATVLLPAFLPYRFPTTLYGYRMLQLLHPGFLANRRDYRSCMLFFVQQAF